MQSQSVILLAEVRHNEFQAEAARLRIVNQACAHRPTAIEDNMYPGLSEADCQVATLHIRQLVNEGQSQQFVASVRPVPAGTRWLSEALRQLGTLVVAVSQRLEGAKGVTRERFGRTPRGERGAIA